jgi:hypothetical protein
MPKHITEEKFEADIVASLVEFGGYIQGNKAHFNTSTGLDPVELFAFLDDSQSTAWETLVKRYGGQPDVART